MIVNMVLMFVRIANMSMVLVVAVNVYACYVCYAASESYYAVGLLLVMTVNMDLLCVMIGSDVCYDG